MSKKKKNQSTLEEALMNNRPDQVPDEPTEDEIVAQAMSDLSAQERLGERPPQVAPDAIPENMKSNLKTVTHSNEYPAETMTGITPKDKIMSNLPEKELRATPASSTDPQPADKTSTQELVEMPPQERDDGFSDLDIDLGDVETGHIEDGRDKSLRRLHEFIHSTEFGADWVRVHLNHISRIPTVIPSLTLWEGTNLDKVAVMVAATMRTPGYIENNWPSLKMVMGSSRDNLPWATGVLCTIAVFDVIHLMACVGDFPK